MSSEFLWPFVIFWLFLKRKKRLHSFTSLGSIWQIQHNSSPIRFIGLPMEYKMLRLLGRRVWHFLQKLSIYFTRACEKSETASEEEDALV